MSWIQTYTGKQFYPLNPKQKDICLLDIAYALSNKCRFNGHCNQFYSVLDHSLIMYNLCTKDNKLRALFHDAAEAYLPDVPTPIKSAMYFIRPNNKNTMTFREAESNILSIIFKKYKLGRQSSSEVDINDNKLLYYEMKKFMPDQPQEWGSESFSVDKNNFIVDDFDYKLFDKVLYNNSISEFLRICERNNIRD